MKIFKKAVSVLCAVTISASMFAVCVSASNEIDYTIKNPYQYVNWSTYTQYKADLHSHTTASDGTNSLKEMTEAHYAHDFDIVSVTDHGIIDYGWKDQQVIPVMKLFIKWAKGRGIGMEALKETGTTGDGNSYTYKKIVNDEFYSQTVAGNKGHDMMYVPLGIEHNPTSINNAHVNSWFADYGNAIVGGTSDYVTPISNVDKKGGLSVINHPGEYTNARDELYSKDAYNQNNVIYRYKTEKFASLLRKYPSCMGIDMNSKGDDRTRFDRVLWDILLQKVVPSGRNVLAIASSDAHSTSAAYSGYTMMPLESLTSANLKKSMQEGSFFAASKNLGNYEEIKEIADLLTASSQNDKKTMGAELTTLYKKIETELANGDQKSKYNAPYDVEAPMVTKVTVDNNEDSISLQTTSDALVVRWIADGKLIATGNDIDLDDYSDKIGSYVRAEIFGKGGIVYTQAFTLTYDGAPTAQKTIFVDLWKLASFIPDSIVRAIVKAPIFNWIWDITNK